MQCQFKRSAVVKIRRQFRIKLFALVFGDEVCLSAALVRWGKFVRSRASESPGLDAGTKTTLIVAEHEFNMTLGHDLLDARG
jgi:hypothetical protein